MKRLFLILILAPTMFLAAGCDNVPAGYVGVKVQRYGDDRGVNVEVKGPGRYFNGPNVDMFIFPTFTQSYVWDKAGKSDESFTFQTVEGLSVNTDIGVSYAIPRENAPKVFQKYRRGVDEITGVYLRAIVRDALNLAGASMAVEDVYGRGKAALQQRVEDEVKANAAKVGISVEKVYFVNQMRLPEQVMNSINGKIAATQIAQQKENELRAAEADAAKQVAIAKGEAEALEVKAKALRENSQILQQMAIEKWDGKLPQYARRVVGCTRRLRHRRSHGCRRLASTAQPCSGRSGCPRATCHSHPVDRTRLRRLPAPSYRSSGWSGHLCRPVRTERPSLEACTVLSQVHSGRSQA